MSDLRECNGCGDDVLEMELGKCSMCKRALCDTCEAFGMDAALRVGWADGPLCTGCEFDETRPEVRP